MKHSEKAVSDDEDESTTADATEPTEDMHDALKIVLQRQFFESLIRAAAVRYASGGGELTTLSMKLDYLMKNNFQALAVKNKCKSVEEEKAFKVADKIFQEYNEPLMNVFKFFSSTANRVKNGRSDVTIQVVELLDLLRKANLVDNKNTDVTTEDVIHMVEKYFDPASTLKSKVGVDKFKTYLSEHEGLCPPVPEDKQTEEGVEP